MTTVKTKKGTELPLLDLRGKNYLQVAHRLVWFREDHPMGRIETRCVDQGADFAVFHASVSVPNEKGEYVLLATATKREDVKGFGDFIEKAETGSIGRALALCGYGTQFTDDLEEGERIVDAPQPRAAQPVRQTAAVTPKVGNVTRVGSGWDNGRGRV